MTTDGPTTPSDDAGAGPEAQTSRASGPRTGVRFVLSDCASPSQDEEFNAWYDAYSADCLVPGLYTAVARYENPTARGGWDGARYLAVYDTSLPSPHAAWTGTAEHPARKRAHLASPDLRTVIRATYATIASVSRGMVLGGAAVRVVLSALSPGADPPTTLAWESRLSQVLESPACVDASAFMIVDGSPDPPVYLEIYGMTHVGAVPATRWAAGNQSRAAASLMPRYSADYRMRSRSAPQE